MTRVLVVEDDATVSDVVRRYLERENLAVEVVADGQRAWNRALADPPDLVVLDLMLPGLSGLELCRRLRTASTGAPRTPVMILTALGEEADRITGLELGADDYLVKPFSPRELTLRALSVLRRSAPAPSPPELLGDGALVVDPVGRTATRDGVALTLTLREFDLLVFLLSNPGRAFTRAELLDQVWGWDYGDRSTVTVHVRRLREKIEDRPGAPARIVTVWGIGYRFDPAGALR